MKYDVFISYSSKDQKIVEGICGYLESHGIRCFVAYRDIPKGKAWASTIVEGLDDSSMMLIAFSESFNRSAQVDREIELAAEDKKPILTFRLTDVNFEGAKKYYLKNLNWIDAFPNPEECFGELHKNICSLLNMSNSSRTDIGVENNESRELKMRHISDSANNHPVEPVMTTSVLTTAAEGAEIHVDTDMNCRVLLFNKEIAVARPGEETIIQLKKGRHKLDFISTECADDRLQMIYSVEEVDSVDIITVELLPVREKREDDERRKRETYLLQLPDNRFQIIIKNDKYGFSDLFNNEPLISLIYDWAESFSEGLANVKKDGKWGFIDKTGKTAIPFIYDWAESFSEGLANVKKDEKWGFIDKTGKTAIPLIYDYAESFSEGLAVVRYGKWGFVDKTGKTAVPFIYALTNSFSEGLALVEKDRKRGFIDKTGKTAIPLIYDWAYPFSEGMASVKKDGKYGFIDKRGKTAIPFIYDGAGFFSEGLAPIVKDEKVGFVDKTGKTAIPLIYDRAGFFSEGLASVKKDGKYGFIDKTGKTAIPFIYDDAKFFRKGLAKVEKDGKWGFVDRTGRWMKPL